MNPEQYDVEAVGEIELEEHVLVIKRIVVHYRLAVAPERREEAERVHGFHARFCPVARSISGTIDLRTELEFT